jgi:hypothetical protein
MQNPTIVTALLDIGRDQTHPQFRRSFRSYINSLKRLAKLDLPMVIHADSRLHPRIMRWRQGRTTTLHSLCKRDLTPEFSTMTLMRSLVNLTGWRSQHEKNDTQKNRLSRPSKSMGREPKSRASAGTVT